MKDSRKKNLLRRLGLLLLSCHLFLGAALAQQEVSGTVMDPDGMPLIGATVTIKGTVTGTITDIDGKFSIQVGSGEDILVVSSVGMVTQEIPAGDQTEISVTMTTDLIGLDEVVVVGYGTVKKNDITGSVASIDSDDLLSAPIASIDQGMQGKMAGVTMQNTSGAPGQPMKIRIRGGGSINYSNNPLYVIDGFVGGDITSVNPLDIERIDILKDASATAIYGSRGANGVVLITTKSPKKGAFTVTLDATFGISNQVKTLDFLDAATSATYYNIIREDLDQTPYFTEEEIDYFEENGQEDYVDLVTRQAVRQNYNLSMSGGGENVSYMFSGGYLDDQGVINNSFKKKYSLRSNITAQVKPWLDVRFNTYGTHSKALYNSVYDRSIMDAYMYPIFWPNKDEEGNYINNSTLPSFNGLLRPGENPNPIQYNETQANQENLNEGLTSNLDFTFKFLKHFELMISGSGRYYNTTYGKMALPDGIRVTEENQTIEQGSGRGRSLISTNMLTYKNTFGSHDLSVSAVYEFTDYQNRYLYARVADLATTGNDWYIMGNGIPDETTSTYYEGNLQSYMARINYAFASRYLLTATARVDQSSVFQGDNQSSFFPSGALGWVISKEDFLRDVDWVHNLKLRAGYGETGNQAVGPYATLSKLRLPPNYWDPVYYYAFNGVDMSSGVLPQTTITDPEIRWETTVQTNFGVDLSILNGRVSMTADYYIKNTEDVILARSLPYYTGRDAITSNYGEISNKGFEFMVYWSAIEQGDFRMSVDANLTINRNEVKDLGGEDHIFLGENSTGYGMWGYEPLFIVEKGEPLGLIYGIKSLGLWQEDEAEEAAVYNSYPGEHRYEDLDGDGKISETDRQVIGHTQPSFTYGINLNLIYKGFTLTIGGLGVSGNEIYNYNRHYMDKQMLNPDYNDRWSPENAGATQQRLPIGAQASDKIIASQYIEDGTFFKINNMTLNYSLPKSVLESIRINSLSVFASVNNLLTITQYSGVDPENSVNSLSSDSQSGIDSFSYPLSRTFTFGFKANF